MSGDLPVWAQIMTGLAILALLFFFGPSAYRAAKESPKGSAGDWLGLLIPIGGVVLFIILLIALARG
jgi:cobalamin synthase